MSQKLSDHPFIIKLHHQWNLTPIPVQHTESEFQAIGNLHNLTIVCTNKKTSEIRAYVAHHHSDLVVFLHPDNPELIDLYAQTVLDERPVIVHDLNWIQEKDFWSLNTYTSGMEFIFELDRRFGRRRLEMRFVSEFRKYYKKISESWMGLSSDSPQIRNQLSMHTLIRLLFIAFLQARHALDNRPHFILEEASNSLQSNTSIYRNFIQPLFFKTLNCPSSKRTLRARNFGNIPFLNGGLFSPTIQETHNPNLDLPNDLVWTVLSQLLDAYDFGPGIGDNSRQYLDPMMLGHVFESLMSSDQRALTGSFYTPMALARQITTHAFIQWLSQNTDLDSESAKKICEFNDFSEISVEMATKLESRLSAIRILDPSAGSGSFLQCALDTLVRLRLRLSQILSAPHIPSNLAKSILAENIYGVDILQDATELCSLRLWLALIGLCPQNTPLPILPNLDMNIQCGDTLTDLSQYRQLLGIKILSDDETEHYIKLKNHYRTSTGKTKKLLSDQIHKHTEKLSAQMITQLLASCDQEQSDLQKKTHSLFDKMPQMTFEQKVQSKTLNEYKKQIQRWHDNHALSPGFSFDIQFSEVIQNGGFDIILGNPPWYSLHTMPKPSQQIIRSLYQTARTVSHKSSRQAADISAIFIEKSLNCVRTGGIISMLLPNKLFSAPSYHNFRTFIASHARILSLQNYDHKIFEASTYPCALCAQKLDISSTSPSLSLPQTLRPVIEDPDPLVRTLCQCEIHIHDCWDNVKRGICTGANDCYIGSPIELTPSLTQMHFKAGNHWIEQSLIHPVIRGASLSDWQYASPESIVFPYSFDQFMKPINELPPLARSWFELHKDTLTKQLKSTPPYYSVSGSSPLLTKMKVVWRDISVNLEACFIKDSNVIPLNTVYYIPVDNEFDGYLLAAYLNSSVVRSFCRSRAEHALNNYRRYFAWLIRDIPWIFGLSNWQNDILCRKIVDLSIACHSTNKIDIRNKYINEIDKIIQQYILNNVCSHSKRNIHPHQLSLPAKIQFPAC